MTRRWSIPYLQVVPADGSAPDFTPPCPPTVDPNDWQAVYHGDEIRAGKYDYWCAHGGPFVSDDVLKAQGLLAPDWSRVVEITQSLFGSPATHQPTTDSIVPVSPVSDSAQGKGVMTMHDQNEPPNPFLQLMAYLYDEPDWENPDPNFMDRPPRPLRSKVWPAAPSQEPRWPRYLTVVPRDLRDDARHE